MRSTQNFLFPAALLGSLLVALLAFTATSGFTAPPNNKLDISGRQSDIHTSLYLPAVTQMNGVEIHNVTEEKPGQQANINVNNPVGQPCQISSSYPDNIKQWCQLISFYSIQSNLDPDLIAALIWQESGGNPTAYSHSGAVGLMQVMPSDGIASSFVCKNGPCFTNRPTISELQDPEFNIQYGTRMLKNLQLHYGNLRDALKHYGPMDVGYSYADKVISIYNNNKQ